MDEIISKGSINGKQFYELHIQRTEGSHGAVVYNCRAMIDTGLEVGLYQRTFYGDADDENLIQVIIDVLIEFAEKVDGKRIDDISPPDMARRFKRIVREISGEAPG